ncbi:MAG: SprB repeat-containing protein [Bacteroidota bacterium]
MKKPYLILLYFLCFNISLFAQPKRYFVNPDAIGQNNGLNWQDAFTKLNNALTAAQAGDEIWVADGIYYASETSYRNDHFELASGVKLFGGFAGSESSLNERQPNLYPSIFDGDINTPNDSTDNSYNLLYLANPDSNTVVDGFVFRNALANRTAAGSTELGAAGAALYIMAETGSAYPLIRNCIFEHNTANGDGGAVYINGNGVNSSVAPVFEHCRFSYNRSLLNGGALARNGGSRVDRPRDIDHCVFEYNRSNKRGGAIFFKDAPGKDTFDIYYTKFDLNFAPINPVAGGEQYGSDLHLSNMRFSGSTTLAIKHCEFYRSIKQLGASDDYFDSGNLTCMIDSVYFGTDANIETEGVGWGKYIIQNTVFERNAMINGSDAETSDICSLKNIQVKNNSQAIIKFQTKLLKVDNFILSKNNLNSTINQFGYLPGESMRVNNFLVYSNAQPGQDEGFTFSNFAFDSTSSISIKNVTAYNTFIHSVSDTSRVFNSIFAGDYPELIIPPPPYYFTYKYTLYDHNIFIFADTITTKWVQTNNLWSTDPQFVDPAAGDFRLKSCSRGINAGFNIVTNHTTDLLGNPRIRFDKVDIGAFEMGDLEFATPATITGACIGSQNGEIDLSGLDLCPPAVYHWNGFPDNNTAVQPELAPGPYHITVTDKRGRSVDLTIQVPALDPPVANAGASPVHCGDTLGGAAFAHVSNAPAPYLYNWGASTDSVFTGLAAGSYTVTVMDGRGCTATATAQVGLSGSLNVQVGVTPISCFGAADGSLTITPMNGKTPFNWVWNNGPNGPSNTSLTPGTYTGTLSDAFNCNIQWILPLTEPDPLSFNHIIEAATGAFNADGEIHLDSMHGGTQPYSFNWSNGQTGVNLYGLLPGTYRVTMTDEHQCALIRDIEVPFVVAASESNKRPFECRIIPNPATSDACFLKGTGQGNMTIQIFDGSGRVVYHDTWYSQPDVPFERKLDWALPASAYPWRVTGTNRSVSGVLITKGN